MAETELVVVTVPQLRPILIAFIVAVTPGIILSEEIQERLWLAFVETLRAETNDTETPILTRVVSETLT